MDFTSIWNFLSQYELATAILAVIGTLYILASLIASITPTKADDDFLSKIGRLFTKIGFDIKKYKIK